MAVVEIQGHWFEASGDGVQTIDVNIPPASVFATVVLYGHTGGGTSYTGIKHFRRRLDSGEDQDVDFGDWTAWPPCVFDFISSITFGIATGRDQIGWAYARMDFWE